MKNRGFTLVEIMTVTGISMGIAAIIFSIFIVLNTGLINNSTRSHLKQQSQNALDFVQGYLEKANNDSIEVIHCEGPNCNGDAITFQTPIVNDDAVSGTAFNSVGGLKWGTFAPGSTPGVFRTYYGYFRILIPYRTDKLVLETWEYDEPDPEIHYGGGGSKKVTPTTSCDPSQPECQGDPIGGTGGEGGLPWGKLFHDILDIKEAFATTTDPELRFTRTIATDVEAISFVPNEDNTIVAIKIQFKKTTITGKPITHEAFGKVSVLIH